MWATIAQGYPQCNQGAGTTTGADDDAAGESGTDGVGVGVFVTVCERSKYHPRNERAARNAYPWLEAEPSMSTVIAIWGFSAGAYTVTREFMR